MEQIFSKLERQARDSSLWDYYTLMTETTKGGGISIGDVFPSLLILPGLDFENKTYFNWTKNNQISLRSKSNGVCKTREV